MPKQPKPIKKNNKTGEDSSKALVGTIYNDLIPEGIEKLKALEAMSCYLSTGNIQKVERLTGVSPSQMNTWMESPWWPEATAELKKRQQEALDGRITGLMALSLDVVEERLTGGDPTWVKDEGLVNIPIKAGVAAKIMGTLYEKRALIRGDATSHVVKEDSGLAVLKNMLEKIAKEKKTEREIPGERLE